MNEHDDDDDDDDDADDLESVFGAVRDTRKSQLDNTPGPAYLICWSFMFSHPVTSTQLKLNSTLLKSCVEFELSNV